MKHTQTIPPPIFHRTKPNPPLADSASCSAAGDGTTRVPRPSCHTRGIAEFSGRPLRLAGRLLGVVPLGVGALLLGGCVLGPNHPRPSVSAPAAWKEGSTETRVPFMPEQWWTLFEDPDLDALETQAVKANQDLKRAAARVTEARAIARVSRSELYPSVNGSAAYSRDRNSENRDRGPIQRVTDDFSSSFDWSYELDVWGRVRRSIEAARADLAATETDLQVVLLTLTADVARNYQLLRFLERERGVIEATLALRKDTLSLQQTRNRAGLINEVDVTRARTELANVEAELQSVIRSASLVEHALAVLCGQPPAAFVPGRARTEVAPPQIPAGLPAELLQRRPDIVAAEHRLEAANARIGVAKAAFFPTIKLTGAAGFGSADLASLVDWPSRFASFGPSITVPIFQGGRNQAELKAAEARYEQNVAAYRASVLTAFREVEDSLSELGGLARQTEAVDRALASARDTARLAEERYQRGLSSYLEVVDAQRAALQAERESTQLRGQRAISTILLAKALGGGWQSGSTAKTPHDP